MRVFKRTFKDKVTGERREVSRHWVDWVDHLRIHHRWPAFREHRKSVKFGERLERLAECRRGHDTPDDELSRWLDTLPADIRKRMIDVGLIDETSTMGDKPLIAHLEGERDAAGVLTFTGFKQKLEAKGNTSGYVGQQVGRVRKMLDGCGFVFWSDLCVPGAASRVEVYLAGLRTDAGEIRGQTANYYAQALRQFCRWMVKDKRARFNPLASRGQDYRWAQPPAGVRHDGD